MVVKITKKLLFTPIFLSIVWGPTIQEFLIIRAWTLLNCEPSLVYYTSLAKWETHTWIRRISGQRWKRLRHLYSYYDSFHYLLRCLHFDNIDTRDEGKAEHKLHLFVRYSKTSIQTLKSITHLEKMTLLTRNWRNFVVVAHFNNIFPANPENKASKSLY